MKSNYLTSRGDELTVLGIEVGFRAPVTAIVPKWPCVLLLTPRQNHLTSVHLFSRLRYSPIISLVSPYSPSYGFTCP